MAYDNRDRVKTTLVFYFKLLFEKSGIEFTNDNFSEITEIVDQIYNDVEALIKKSLEEN